MTLKRNQYEYCFLIQENQVVVVCEYCREPKESSVHNKFAHFVNSRNLFSAQ